MNLSTVKDIATRAIWRGGLIVSKYGPDFMLGFGITGLVGATVIALSEKTKMRAEEVIEMHRENMDVIEEARATCPDKYSEDDKRQDTAIAMVRTGMKIAKIYGPAVILGVTSVGCILGSHEILNRRNLGLMAAYTALDEGFKKYRGRVVSELGKESDYHFRHGTAMPGEEYDEKDGQKKVIPEEKKVSHETRKETTEPSIYAVWFSEESTLQWRKDAISNEYFLKSQQNYANDKLKAHGHLFLNEVYDSLGLPRTSAGAVVGWLANSDGDNKVDFGLYNPVNDGSYDPIDGYNRPIFLDFNVDGSIWDKI